MIWPNKKSGFSLPLNSMVWRTSLVSSEEGIGTMTAKWVDTELHEEFEHKAFIENEPGVQRFIADARNGLRDYRAVLNNRRTVEIRVEEVLNNTSR